MIDRIIDQVVDELALEGENGCSFDQLWIHVKTIVEELLESYPIRYPLISMTNTKHICGHI
ncbi:unnamed protein product [Rhizopus microsporus]